MGKNNSEKDPKLAAACRLMDLLSVGGYPTRLVGGCVRDRALGLTPKDYDLATTALPEEVQALCHGQGMKTVPTGLAFGTVTVILNKAPFEVTTLRKDIRTDGRHAEVEFGTSFEEDAARRDFTMNAMSEDSEGQVYDYFEGRKHLNEKVLMFVNDAATRIREDYLRIMRFFRFKTRYGLHTDAATFTALAQEQDGLTRVSKERITQELWQILACPYDHASFCEMIKTGVLETLFPQIENLSQLCVSGHPHTQMQKSIDALADEERPIARLGLWFLVTEAKTPENILDLQLRLSNAQRTRLLFALQGLSLLDSTNVGEQASVFDFVDACEKAGGPNALFKLYGPVWRVFLGSGDRLTRLQSVEETERLKSTVRKRPTPVSGKDIADWLGVPPSPELGELLQYVTRSYRNELWQTRDEARLLLAKRVHH